MKSAVVFLLVLIVAGLGYFVYERETEKQAQHAAEEQIRAKEAAIIALQQLATAAMEKAIQEKRVVKGMTKVQVQRSWGDDYERRGSYEIDSVWKKDGVREIWAYSGNRAVYFDFQGQVLFTGRAY